jgi:hypothetical protein
MSFHLSLITEWYHRGASKMISELMVRLAQTMHLSCIDINTVSKIERREI